MFVLRRVNSFWKNVLEREVLTLRCFQLFHFPILIANPFSYIFRFFPKETVEMKTLLIAAHSFPNLRHLHLGYISTQKWSYSHFDKIK